MEMLPTEMVQEIYEYLPVNNALIFSLTCKDIRKALNKEMWTTFYERDFGLTDGTRKKYVAKHKIQLVKDMVNERFYFVRPIDFSWFISAICDHTLDTINRILEDTNSASKCKIAIYGAEDVASLYRKFKLKI